MGGEPEGREDDPHPGDSASLSQTRLFGHWPPVDLWPRPFPTACASRRGERERGEGRRGRDSSKADGEVNELLRQCCKISTTKL